MAQANNLIQIKRTSISGRAANTTTLPNPGELALNMTDGILYSGNGSVVFEIGANNTNVNVSGNLAVKAIIANNSIGAYGQVLYSSGSDVYWGPGASGFTGSRGDLGYTGSFGTTGFTGSVGYVGSQGDVGYVGSRGDLGFTGSRGNDGSNGNNGLPGDTGAPGYTGSQGDLGYTGSSGYFGSTGFTGSKGADGTIGYDGSVGYTGSQGVGFTGSVGYVGSKGDLGYVGSQGPQGSFGGAAFDYTFDVSTANTNPGNGKIRLSNAAFGSATTLYINENADNSVSVYNFLQTIDDSTSLIKGHFTVTEKANTNNFALFSITGSHVYYTNYFGVPVSYLSGSTSLTANLDIIVTFARTGDIGDTGFTGSVGSIGYTGSRGNTGNTGNTGSVGYTGSFGDTGFTGSVGFTGSKGDTGFTGSFGTTGFTGSVGYAGSQGDLGYAGSVGFTGSVGGTGNTGSLGYTGSQGVGYAGSQGPQGVSVYVSATAPVAPANGDVWWNTNLGSLFIYYNDGDTSQWVSAAPSAGVITPTADPFNQFLLAGM